MFKDQLSFKMKKAYFWSKHFEIYIYFLSLVSAKPVLHFYSGGIYSALKRIRKKDQSIKCLRRSQYYAKDLKLYKKK